MSADCSHGSFATVMRMAPQDSTCTDCALLRIEALLMRLCEATERGARRLDSIDQATNSYDAPPFDPPFTFEFVAPKPVKGKRKGARK